MMEQRMKNPAMVIPDAMKAIQALIAATMNSGVPQKTMGLVMGQANFPRFGFGAMVRLFEDSDRNIGFEKSLNPDYEICWRSARDRTS